MTSGEWDLRALKALEEEEQKEFLALSQKNLFEPPSPPKQQQHQHHHPQQQQKQHGVLQPTYASQFQPQLLKLPTINECNLITKRGATRQEHAPLGTGAVPGGGPLKFSRALSLSSHSLGGRDGSGGGGSSSNNLFSGGNASGGGSGLLASLGRRAKARFALTKSSGSLSASQYSNSPVYTPPPMRRCATLHHTQPVRKAFKTLQQLEKQRQERKKAEAEKVLTGFSSNAPRHKSPQLQLQRVAGTNKTYWKYGANSTAASIIGQRTQQKQQQQQRQQKITQKPLTSHKPSAVVPITAEIESNTSDEYGSDEGIGANNFNFDNNNGGNENNSINAILQRNNKNINNNNRLDDATAMYYDDSATETGSCTVPLAADSIEMMRLMLTAAKTAVTTTSQQLPTAMPTTTISPAITTASSAQGYLSIRRRMPDTIGTESVTFGATSGVSVDDYQQQTQQDYRKTIAGNSTSSSTAAAEFTTLTRRYQQLQQQQQQSVVPDPDETVAYKAFHALARRKSFSGGGVGGGSAGALLRTAAGNSNQLQANSAVSNSGRRLLKSTSVETPTQSTVELNGASNGIGSGPGSVPGPGVGVIMTSNFIGAGMQRSTIITNPIVENIKSTTTVATTVSGTNTGVGSMSTDLDTTNHMCSLAKKATVSRGGLHQQRQYSTHATTAALLCHELHGGVAGSPSGSPSAASSPVIDDELEQHIKHCSCSCNHMGYGNSMDYQTTGFGGLPDVTEHSNIRRTLSRQNSISNSDSGGEIASIQKSKVNFGDQIKSPTSSGGAGGGDGSGGGGGVGGSSAAAKRRKSKAAQQGGTGAIVQGYKTRRGSFAIGLTLVAALCLLAIAAMLAYQHFFMAPSRNSHTQRLRIVRRILREVPLVDGHNNFAWNVRKYAHSSLELVHVHHDLDQKTLWTRPTWAQTDMERLKQGLVGVQVWSAYVPCEAQGLDAVQLALEQIDIIRRLADMYAAETTLVASSQDITAARRRGLMASLIGIEGGHAIGASLGVLRSFYSLGARYLSLTHRCDVSWASSSVSSLDSHGLTQFGKAIIREMNRLGMMIDLSYSSDATARDVLQVTRAPVIFSHSAARQLCNSTRNIPDDILRLVAENGGLIMVSFDSEDVACGGAGRQARLKDVIDHIKYIRSIAGIQHIGLGAGYDGIEMPPIGLEDVSKYPDLLATLLEDHNWSEEDIAMLAGKNFLRIMETVENVRDYWKRAAIQPIEQTEPQPKSQCTYMSS